MEIENVTVRPIKKEEYSVLENFLYDAIFQPESSTPLKRDIIYKPELHQYIKDFGRADDCCLAAEYNGEIVGLVWARILAGPIRGYGNMDDKTPELAISVKQEYRHQGIGLRLMQEMLDLMRAKGYSQVSLSVDKDNYALLLYQKLGFQTIEEREEDYLMVFSCIADTK